MFSYIKMIMVIHAVCFIIGEFSLPTWQKESRNIHNIIQAREEDRNNETASK